MSDAAGIGDAAGALTVPGLLAARAAGDGSRAAVSTPTGSITYLELDRESVAVARELVGGGVSKGSRVGLLMENGIPWVVVAMAVTRVGAVLVPLSTLLRPGELQAQLRQAAVSHLVMTPAFRGRDYVADLRQIAPGWDAFADSPRRSGDLPALTRAWCLGRNLSVPATVASPTAVGDDLVRALGDAVRPADDLAVMFTSGSRGAPKGVVHTHGNAIRATASGLQARCVRRGDRLYIPMPMFWMGGFGGGMLSTIVAGATLLTEAIPEPTATLEFLERERVTLFRGWPDQAERLAAHPSFPDADLSSLRAGSLDGVLPAEMRAAPGARANLFGMTESFGPYSSERADRDLPPGKWGSCGRPFDGMEVRITDPETGAVLGPGAVGMIELRGPNLMRGIVGRTKESTFGPDGYYATGDLGHLDADGYLFFSGRHDDMFKVRGASVYPTEVEAVVGALPGVARAHVADVDGPNGTEVGAAVQLRAAPETELAGLVAETRARLSAFKVPTIWLRLGPGEDVPRTATGKVDKKALQQLLREQGTPT